MKRGPGFADVLRVGEFRALWGAELFSVLGDQLARVALALLVFEQTSSAALSALTYALTFAPAVLGGLLLSGLADRYPRRRVLVATDVIRAVLAAAMAIPALPLPAMWALVAVLSMAAAPFKAAQLALLPQILEGDRYVVGLSLRQITGQSAQLAGFASGGLLLAVVEPHIALAANAMTFVVSAALILTGVRPRPAPSAADQETRSADTPPIIRKGQLLPVIALVCVASLFAVPEGVAAPYGAVLGVGSIGVGLLMAADPLGSVIGAWLTARFLPRASPAVAVALAAAAGIPLIVCAIGPGLGISLSLALWAVSGALSTAYLIHTLAILADLVPDHRRGRVMGRTATCLYTSQGLAIVTGGIAAEVVGPFRAVALAGLLGAVLALCVGGWWRSVARSRRDLAAGSERSSSTERSPQMSLVTTNTSSQAASADDSSSSTDMSHQMSLVTINTSSPTDAPAVSSSSTDMSHQMSLVTINTSSPTDAPAVSSSSTERSPQMSLVTTNTSSRADSPDDTATERSGGTDGSPQMSLVTTDTSSQADCLDDAVTEPFLANTFVARSRRPGTQAPSLWAYRLRSAVGRLIAGRVASG